MRGRIFACVTALVAAALPAVALADDPQDSGMRSSAARERDRVTIQRMNQQQLAYVRDRDARIMRDYRRAQKGGGEAGYADARADYERKMASWRRAVAACNAGQWEYCDN